MARTINNIEDANKHVDKGDIRTIITFRTQQLYDLWVNEMSGQISDGMWENARHTDWLWRNVLVTLGDETKVEVASAWGIGRRSFGMTKDLWDVIGDRIMDENGFATEKEAKAAWREIAQAIYSATATPAAQSIRELYQKEKQQKANDQKDALKAEWLAAGADEQGCNGSYWSATIDLNPYVFNDIQRTSYLFLHVRTDSNGVLSTQIEYNSSKFYAAQGKLVETVEAIKEFDRKLLQIKGARLLN